jgi:hypothetical protein
MGEGVALDRGECAGVASGEGEDPHEPALPMPDTGLSRGRRRARAWL